MLRLGNDLDTTRCFVSIGLYGNRALPLPICILVEEYKCANARLEMTQGRKHKRPDIQDRNRSRVVKTKLNTAYLA